MNEYEKMRSGYLHWSFDESIVPVHAKAKVLCSEYDAIRPEDVANKRRVLTELLQCETDALIMSPFCCDCGCHIHLGKRCYINSYCYFMDNADITLGDNALIGPYCCICTHEHPLDQEQRDGYLGCCRPVVIGNSVWLGARVTVMPGVTIGDNVVVGAGSLVTHDLPSNVLAYGSPCRVVRELTAADKRRFPVLPEDEDNPLYHLGNNEEKRDD